jgi:O-antigen chain-terminating methyltransferase
MLIRKKPDIPYEDLENRLYELDHQAPSTRWQYSVNDLGQAAPELSRPQKLKISISNTPVLGRLAHWLWPYCRPTRIKQALASKLRRFPAAHRLVRWAYHLASGPRRQSELHELLLKLNHRTLVLKEQVRSLDTRHHQDSALLDALLKKCQHDIQRTEDTLRLMSNQTSTSSAPSVAGRQTDQPVVSPFIAAALDRFYKAFEDRFRGEESTISQRLQAAYGEYIQHLGPDSIAVDLGCGRGEWLTLLTERGVSATGVDITASMVERCRSKGLRVKLADAASYLAGLQPDSVNLITAFHVAEHLEFPHLLELIVLARRALCDGGMLILETPNPENLQVGANTFYMDPTHLHPLPPALLAFAAQSQGFERTHIERLHPFSELDAGHNSAAETLLFGPQDYAMIAWK